MQKWEHLKVSFGYRTNIVKIWPPDAFEQEWLFGFVGRHIEIDRRELLESNGWLWIDPLWMSKNTKAAKNCGLAAGFLRYLGEQGWEVVEDRRGVMTFKRPIEE